MEKLQLIALVQAYTGVGIGLMVGLGALGACVGVGIMCSRFLEGAARQRVGEIIGSAEKRDAQMLDEAKAAARAEADRILAAAKADIDQQVARAREALREQVAALAVAGAEKILRREINSEAHAELLGQLKREI